MKSIVKFFSLIAIIPLILQCANSGTNAKEEPEEAQDWVWLFDGSSTDHWRGTKNDTFPGQRWVVEDDVLVFLGETEDRPGGQDIVSKQKFSNFELELEVKLSEGGNSGIKYFLTDSFPGKEGSFLGLEYQLIDNERHPDAKQGRDGNRQMAALYDLIPPLANYVVHPPGEWNKVRIIVDGNHVEHWLNGEKVLEFDRKSEAFRELVSISKYKNLENFGELDEGRLLLQGHKDFGNDVFFRNIKIRTW
jgi:hypothetical protein